MDERPFQMERFESALGTCCKQLGISLRPTHIQALRSLVMGNDVFVSRTIAYWFGQDIVLRRSSSAILLLQRNHWFYSSSNLAASFLERSDPATEFYRHYRKIAHNATICNG